MVDEGFKRKLTSILSADAVEYSRLMSDDEEATIRTITEYRTIISQLVEKNDGRVVDSPGDNILAEFASVVDAVKCAVKTQKKLAEQNDHLPDNRKMEFRIGVNLGDIAEDGDRIYGDGVNVAARIEGLADPGGICVSHTAYDQVKNKLELGYEYLGEPSLKNITEQVRVYKILTEPDAVGKVIGEKRKTKRVVALAIVLILLIGAGGLTGWYLYIQQFKRIEPASIEKMAYPLPEKPSIAVLPFDNMSGDPEDEYIADGIAENIITALAKIDSMFVIARNSSFAYKGKPVKIKDVSEEFGVQYVLEGSIQRSGDRIRVTAQLIDALSGHHLWADQYNKDMKGLFEILDEITKNIVTGLDAVLTAGEQFRLYTKGTDNLQAWVHFSKGYSYSQNWVKRENTINAIKQFEKALEIDPNFAAAWASLGLSHMNTVVKGWNENPSESLNKYFEYTKKAIALDKNSPLAHALLGDIYRRQGEYEKAIGEGKIAIALEPNNSRFHYYLSRAMHLAGKPDEAVELMKKAIRLNPIARPIALYQLGTSLICAGRYEEALKTFDRAIDSYKMQGGIPYWVHTGLTVGYLELGQIDNARSHFKEALTIEPNINFIAFAKTQLAYKDEDLDRLKRLFKPISSMAKKEVKTKQYVHKGSPEFRFKYPEQSKKLELTGPAQVLRMQTPKGIEFYALVFDIPEGMRLEDIGPKDWLPIVKKKGSGTNFELISNEPITLNDGTIAYKTIIKWLYKDGDTRLTTILVSAFKDDKCVSLETSTGGEAAEVSWIVESLTFKQ